MTNPGTDTRPRAVPRAAVLAAVSFLAFLGFIVLAARVWHRLGPLHFDRAVQARIPPRPEPDDGGWLNLMSDPGRPWAVIAESLVIATFAWRRSGRLRTASFCAIVPILVGITADLVLKPLIDRRVGAYSQGLSFPSGHTTGVTSVAVAAWLTWVLFWPRRFARVAGALGLVAVVAAVGASRVLLHAHFSTDVVGGVLYGAAATLAVGAVWLPASERPEASVALATADGETTRRRVS